MCTKVLLKKNHIMIDSIETNDPTCFLELWEYIPDDFRGPEAF